MRSPHADPAPDPASGLLLVRVGYGDPDAIRLVAEVQAEYVVRYGSPDESPLRPLDFEPPAGSFFVAYLDGEAVATGAWRRSAVRVFDTDRTAEIKRMYVSTGARGRGVARAVLAHLETSAAQAGYEALVLETGIKQPEAIALYASSGYEQVAGFGHYRDSPLSRCFARLLSPVATPLSDEVAPRGAREGPLRQGLSGGAGQLD